MSLYFKVRGVLIKRENEQIISDTFKKRTFVIEDSSVSFNGDVVKNHYCFDLFNNNCTLIDEFEIGENIEVFFNIKCKEYKRETGEDKYFVTLQAWKVLKHQVNVEEKGVESNSSESIPKDNIEEEDPLPF